MEKGLGQVEVASEFKNVVLTALRSDKSDTALLDLVREWQMQFPNMRDLYEALQAIWVDMGFDERSDGGPVQDRLEFVMERVWYSCPVA